MGSPGATVSRSADGVEYKHLPWVVRSVEGDEAEKYEKASKRLQRIQDEISKVIVGQEDMREKLLTAILCDGNVLLESYPGLGKTKTVHTMSRVLGLDFSRIQNTPDLMPSDITGTQIINDTDQGKEFEFQRGPIFANMVLADEINRATPKTQAALLEAMQEKQVTAGNKTYDLDDPFFVMATQNPIDQEGSLHPEETIFVDGQTRTAADALEHAKTEGIKIEEGDGLALYDADLSTQSLGPRGSIEEKECMIYEKQYSGQVFDIETKTGRNITVSGNHPFLVNDSGAIEWRKAEELSTGDRLVSPSRLDTQTSDIPTHSEVLDALDQEFHVVRSQEVEELKQRLVNGECLSPSQLDDLRAASGLSKRQLASETDFSYDQVLGFFDGFENGAAEQISDVLLNRDIKESDILESHRIHRLEDELSEEDAGFFVAFVEAEGVHTENQIRISQKILEDRFDTWVELAESVGCDIAVRERGGCREATVRSKPFVRYLEERYALGQPGKKSSMPQDFVDAYLETMILTESHFDPGRRRITFTQKDKELLNSVAYLLLRKGIQPWIYEEEEKHRLRIQGEDVATYLEEFEWRGQAPEEQEFESAHRTVPVDPDTAREAFEYLGCGNINGISNRQWYNSFRALQSRRDRMQTNHLRSFVEDMESLLERRKNHEYEEINEKAKSCGLTIQELTQRTELTKHSIYSGGRSEQNDFVEAEKSRRLEEAATKIRRLRSLLEADVIYDEIKSIESVEYDGPVIGLAVPGSHNYVAGMGACGINHNTYPLPEAQTDRFMMKVKLDYPNQTDEEEIVNRFTSTLDFDPELEQVLSEKSVIKLQQFTRQVPIADDIRDRAVELAAATRSHDELEFGASPRGSMNLVLAGKARALIQGRDYVSAEDINEMAIPVLRHRIGLSFQAEKQGKTPEDIVEDIVQKT